MTQENKMTAEETKAGIDIDGGVLYFIFVAICFALALGLDSLLHYIFK